MITYIKSGGVFDVRKTCNLSVVNHIILTGDKYYYNQKKMHSYPKILHVHKLVNILDMEVMGG